MRALRALRGFRRLAGRGQWLRALSVAAAVTVVCTGARAQETPLPSDQLFNTNAVNRLDLRVASIDWEKLKQNFQTNEYYPVDVVFNGQTVRNAAMRSRGLGSRNARKPGLRIDMNRYTTDQTFLGLHSFILDNLVQDPSGVHETVTMKIFARLGIPAPREAHVRLYVNNQYAGLYAVIESIDKEFLKRIFGVIGEDTQNDGYLYEFNYVDAWTFNYLGSDLELYKQRFDPKTHESKSDAQLYGPIEELVRLANDLPADQYLPVLGERLDLSAFIRFVAAQNFVGENDGFLGYAGMNNFYFYRLENQSKHVFIAWDDDNAFAFPDFPLTQHHDDNVLMRKAMQVPELRAQYYDVLREATRVTDEQTADGLSWFESEVRRQLDLIFDAMRDDPNKPYSIDAHNDARNAMIQYSRNRARFIVDELRTVR